MLRCRPFTTVAFAVMALATLPGIAWAGSIETYDNAVVAKAEATNENSGTSQERSAGNGGKPKYTYVPKAEYKKRMKAWRDRVAAITAANAQAAAAQDACINSTRQYGCGRFTQRALPAELNIRAAGDPEPPGAGLDPGTIAYMAVARLTLTPPTPGIGPSPQINRWKMAAVGYPLWLWAEGDLNPAPVSQTVYDLSVSLDPRLVKVVYEMGDGHKVACTDPTHRWTRDVKPGAESPWCGYRYEQPSLPKGEYTVTAHTVWAVDWRINATAGTIAMYQSASTTLPVGEVQALVR